MDGSVILKRTKTADIDIEQIFFGFIEIDSVITYVFEPLCRGMEATLGAGLERRNTKNEKQP